jgi:Fuc2NAc and GlcNAc transferase
MGAADHAGRRAAINRQLVHEFSEEGCMSWKISLLNSILVFLASVCFVATTRQYLLRYGVLDIPNSRSSHTVPVPRGGGIGIVAAFLLAVLYLLSKHSIPTDLAGALLGGSTLIAIVGALDDRHPLPAWLRFLTHCAASGWALWCLGGTGALQLGTAGRISAWALQLFVLLGMVWLINLYNFMDGIDGIAGAEAVCVTGFGGFLLIGCGLGGYAAGIWALGSACAGFLLWNWPPAKIFMGDVGSGFLGFALGAFVLSSSKKDPNIFWSWLILLAAFLVDASVTLLQRLLSGACWYKAHCSHAYQHAARRHRSHLKVTSMLAAVNVVWLFPLAWSAAVYPSMAPWLTLLAMVSLACVALHYDAGVGGLGQSGRTD